eukprot:557402-Amphidinium_carterae.1
MISAACAATVVVRLVKTLQLLHNALASCELLLSDAEFVDRLVQQPQTQSRTRCLLQRCQWSTAHAPPVRSRTIEVAHRLLETCGLMLSEGDSGQP